MPRTVVALGGNTLLQDGGSAADQQEKIGNAADVMATLANRGRDLLVTHGNGPHVGQLLLQQEALETDGEHPLDVLVAETQAQIGYPLQRELGNRLDQQVTTVVTQSLVDPDDPAFEDPSKPVGPYYDAAEAAEKPFETAEVSRPSGERAYRRVVPSPEPRAVVEAEVLGELAEHALVVCAGGGGIPVVRGEDGLRGVEAVVDKDRTSQVLAAAVDADELIVLTDVDAAYLDFGTEDQRPLGAVGASTLRRHLADGAFGEGSMAPKVEAAARFVENGGDRAVITSAERVEAALDGEAGTRVTAGRDRTEKGPSRTATK